ncbi:restriction endonuclease subunit S [Mycolicibacterium sp.]|uniref:restriction endonuclease subunit S n=1 Tax=Mycolicibacterium sp. TaxID=2320850 RepID=UPI0037C9C3BB
MSRWPSVALDELATINPGPERLPRAEETISFLGMADVSESGTTAQGTDRLYSEVKNGYTSFQNGDILVAKITPCFQNGKIALASVSHQYGFGSTEFHVVRPGNAVNPRYLLHYLRQPQIRVEGESRMTGSGGQRRVPTSFLSTLPVPLPSHDEQRRVVSILDHVERLRRLRRQAIAAASAFIDSLFVQLFEPSAPAISLGEIADIASGLTKGRRLNPTASTRSVPYMAVVNVQDRRLDLSTVKMIDATPAEIDKFALKEGDLLLTEGGDPDKLGRGTVWQGEIPEAIHQNHIFRVRVTHKDCEPLYLNWLISSPYGKKYFIRSAKQTTGIASINKSQLSSFPVALPSKDDQVKFVNAVHDVQSLSSKHTRAIRHLDALFAVLQAKAFAGEL